MSSHSLMELIAWIVLMDCISRQVRKIAKLVLLVSSTIQTPKSVKFSCIIQTWVISIGRQTANRLTTLSKVLVFRDPIYPLHPVQKKHLFRIKLPALIAEKILILAMIA